MALQHLYWGRAHEVQLIVQSLLLRVHKRYVERIKTQLWLCAQHTLHLPCALAVLPRCCYVSLQLAVILACLSCAEHEILLQFIGLGRFMYLW